MTTLPNPSLVSICNAALSMLGAQRINSLDEDSTRALACRDRIGDTVREVLRAHPWASCTRRARLAASTETPAFGAGKKWPLPADCQRVIHVVPEGVPASIEGREIVADAQAIGVVYVSDQVAVEHWDAMLRQAVAAKLAMNIAPQMGREIGGSVAATYQDALRAARHASGSETTLGRTPDEDWLGARDAPDDPDVRGIDLPKQSLGDFGGSSFGMFDGGW